MGRVLTASELLAAGLVTATFFPGRLMEEVVPRMKRACSQQNLGLQWNKLLLKQHQKSQVSTGNINDDCNTWTTLSGGAGDGRGDGAAHRDLELQAVPREPCQLHQHRKVPSVPETIVKYIVYQLYTN